MKKVLITACILTLSAMSVKAAETAQVQLNKPAETAKVEHVKPFVKKDFHGFSHFEKRLNLSEKQKTQLKELRQKSFEDMKVLMDEMKSKHEEMKAVRHSELSEDAKDKKLESLYKDSDKIKKKMNKLHQKNKKSFKSILTKDQYAKFQRMIRFERKHQKRMMKHEMRMKRYMMMKHHGMKLDMPPKCNAEKTPVESK